MLEDNFYIEDIEEDLEISDIFFYNEEELRLTEDFYSLPLEYQYPDLIDKFREAYLYQYVKTPDDLEKIIPFNEYMDFLDFAKDLSLFKEAEEEKINEPHDDTEIPNNEDPNSNEQIEELESDKDVNNAVDVKYSEKELINNGFYPTRFVIHEHNAKSFHYDLRFGTRFGASAFSFAIPKAKLPDDYSEKILCLRQPTHPAVWLELKSTDTFKDDTGKGPMGSIKLVDRGKCYVKERKDNFVIYLVGDTYTGGYILVHVGNSNSYMIVKTEQILSDEDSRKEEWRVNAQRIYNYQLKFLKNAFKINCDSTQLLFQDNDGSLYNVNNDNIDDANSYQFIVVPLMNSDEMEARKKANPERLPIQLLTEAIAFRLGRYIYNEKLVSDNLKNEINMQLRKIDFKDNYLNMIETVTDDIRFAELISCIVCGHRIFKDSNNQVVNLHALLSHALENFVRRNNN